MKINFVELQNFRKLKSCRINLSDKETLFVGANNSGKTTAMDALIHFLVQSRRKDLSTTDFTLSNWNAINIFASTWVGDADTKGTSIPEWQKYCPSLDVWLEVKDSEVHYVSHLIPTLKWDGGTLGVRLIFQPKNMDVFQGEYLSAFNAAQDTLKHASISPGENELTLWPRTMRDFLETKLHSHFSVQAYILDPAKKSEPTDGIAQPQVLLESSLPLEVKPFDGLFKIDLIEAQRFFTDPSASGDGTTQTSRNLSAQIQAYYSEHLDPSELPDAGDLDALQAIELARSSFDSKLNLSFEPAIKELEGLGYPGFNDPTINLTTKLNPIDSLDHEAAIQFDIQKTSEKTNEPILRLPEKYNGLGYKNLIWMVFKLIGFRDGWMRIGKAGKRKLDEESMIEPLHLVLIEEPEAHLHAQVQQVFIQKAYSVLRNHENLRGEKSRLSTQMVVSTHSSYLAREVDFSNLRYFRRKPAKNINDVPCATVVNLSDTFGEKKNETNKFVARYIRTTHCDLFFANGIILVEGAAERMLVPHFIRKHYEKLSRCYISILEIGGSHAHRIKPLIEKLGLITLVITDIDAAGTDGKSIHPEKGKGYSTNNNTIKIWAPCKDTLDELLEADAAEKTIGCTRVAYQQGIDVDFASTNSIVYPYTFEDSLALSNIKLFKSLSSSTGLAKKMHLALNKATLSEALDLIHNALKSGDKAKMALDLLFDVDPNSLSTPTYIADGLQWLENMLDKASLDFPDSISGAEADGNG